MSYTATHTHRHIHVPWMTVIAVAIAVAVAAAVLILVNQPGTQTTTTSVAPAAISIEAAAVPVPESPALRRQLAEEVASPVTAAEPFAYPRNHVAGTTLAPFSTAVLTGRVATQAAPNDPHPFNHFPGEP